MNLLPLHLDIYKASAGSGKTFLLTTQYLKLLLEHPLKYREILAVTFTNKATREMKERIISELKNLALGKQTAYGEILKQSAKDLSQKDLQKYATTVYTSILHDYSRFNISTIDSFVQGIIRSFIYEIGSGTGIEAGFTIQLDMDIVKEELINRMYQRLDTDQPLRNWIISIAMARLSEGKSWDFKKDMLELVKELFKEHFQEFDTALKAMNEAEKEEAFKKLRSHIESYIKKTENEQTVFAKKAIYLIEENNLEATDFHYGKSGFINHFYKVIKNKFEEPSTRVIQFIDNPEKCAGSKIAPHKKEIIQSISGKIHALLQQIVQHYTQHAKTYYTAKAIRENVGILYIMQCFSSALADYRSDNNKLLISDTHAFLRQLSLENDASFIFEKTGNTYTHFLIDEFQDTSVFQWDNFKPLLESALSQGYYNLIVGDVKQSIYRWRSGDWRLLLQGVRRQLQAYTIKENTLQENYRSSKPVIELNNYLFSVIPLRLQEKFNREIEEAPDEVRQQFEQNGYLQIIKNAYIDCVQLTPDTAPDEGFVHIEFLEDAIIENEEKISFQDQVLQRLPEMIEILLKENKFQPKNIAILTRNNQEAKAIIQRLMEYQQQKDSIQYGIVSADALYISKNEAVKMLIASIQWLTNEQDSISKTFLIKTIAKRSNSDLSQHQLYAYDSEIAHQILPSTLIHNRTELQSLSTFELVNRLIALFVLHHETTDLPYLLAFQDIVLQWSRTKEDGLVAFLHYWQQEGNKKTLPADNTTNAVEVMTIHKSKGLAFDVMLLPFCDWSLDSETAKNNWLWVKTKNTPFNDLPIVPVKYKQDLNKSFFAYEYFEEKLLNYIDALNLLYVATTRARKHVVVFAPQKKEKKEIKSIGDILLDVLHRPENTYPSFDVSLYFNNNKLLFGGNITGSKSQTTEPQTMQINNMIYSSWKNQLAIRPLSLLFQEESVMLPRARGTLLHHALSLLGHPDELPKVLQYMQMKGMITATIKEDMENTLHQVLQNSLLQNWRNGKMQRLSEKEILTQERNIKRPDLILIDDHQTIVIEFKFTEEMNERLKKQLREYITLLRQMQFKNVNGYLLYGFLNIAEIVV